MRSLSTPGYKLDGKKVVKCDTILEWAEAFEKKDRHIGDDTIYGVRVSTVFLGIDHNYFDQGDPLLFETMIFLGRTEEGMMRYSTYEQAEAGHKSAVENIRHHPWKYAVLPWMRYFTNQTKRTLIDFGNEVLARSWPKVRKVQAMIRKLINKVNR